MLWWIDMDASDTPVSGQISQNNSCTCSVCGVPMDSCDAHTDTCQLRWHSRRPYRNVGWIDPTNANSEYASNIKILEDIMRGYYVCSVHMTAGWLEEQKNIDMTYSRIHIAYAGRYFTFLFHSFFFVSSPRCLVGCDETFCASNEHAAAAVYRIAPSNGMFIK